MFPRSAPLLRARRRAFARGIHLLVALVVAAAATGSAQARIHTFKPLRDDRGSTHVFRIVGVDAGAITDARLTGGHGDRTVDVTLVRRAARSRAGLLRLRRADLHPIRSRRVTPTPSRRALARAAGGQGMALAVTTAPQTTITSGPAEGSETISTTAKFSFSSSSRKSSFHCSLDGAPAARCTAGVSYAGLAAGAHRFSVYAVDRYGTPDPTPATRSWTVVRPADPPADPVDTGAPETAITAGPAEGAWTTSTTASFSFTGTDDVGVSGYDCMLDDAAWSTCTPPRGYNDLAAGVHTFRVRAKDAAGNVDPSPATRTWTVGPSTNVYSVPASVPSGCSTDATSQILAWIASVPDYSTVRFGANACYRIEGTLELRARRLTVDGNGATFRSFSPPSDQRAMWRVWNADITLRNMSIVGSYASGGVHDETLQHAHAIDLRGTRGTVENVAMSDVAGDCVYFGLGTARSSGAVRDSSCLRIGRNAVSVTAGEDIRVERVRTDRVGYIVFDVEPNTGSGWGAQRVAFDSNTIGSYYMKAYTIIGNAPVADLSFTNNRVVGESLRIGVVDRGYRPQRVRIAGNTSEAPAPNNAMTLYGITGLTVTGNSVPLSSGTMAYVSGSCAVDVSGNAFPGGSREAFITNSAC